MMSATSIDPQRSKGQASKVQNGSLHQKETVHDNDFEPYLTGQSTQNNSYQSMTDPYLSSYYAPSIGFPYPLSEAPWSTGGDPPIPYLTPYGALSNGDHHFLPADTTVFGQPGGPLGSSIYQPAHHRFNFFPENPAFSAWGAAAAAATSGPPQGSQQQQQQQQQGQQQQTQQGSYGGSYSYPPSSLGGTLLPPDGQTGFHQGGGGASDNNTLVNKAPGGMNSLDQGMVGLKIGGGGDVVAVGGQQGGSGKAVGGGGGHHHHHQQHHQQQHHHTATAVTTHLGGVVQAPLGGGGGGNNGSTIPIGIMPPIMPNNNKPTSWAAIASKPAKPQQISNNNNNNKAKVKPGGMMPGGMPQGLPPPPIKHNMNIGTWDKSGSLGGGGSNSPGHQGQQQQALGMPHGLPMQQGGLGPMQGHHGAPQHAQQQPPQMQPQMALQGPPHHHHQQQHHHHHQPPPHQLQQQQPYQNHSQPPPPQTRWVAPRNRNNNYGGGGGGQPMESMMGMVGGGGATGNGGGPPMGGGGGPPMGPGGESHPVLDKLRANHSYNPKEFEWNLKNGRVFIIKSYSEDDIHRSIKYSIWCSTEHGNKRLDQAFRSLAAKGPVYLLFSVNGSGHFCGVAEMRSPVDYGASAGVWAQDKWKGKFDVAWLFVKDVPNSQLRHIRLENNDNKPVTNSRDTQEVPLEKAKLVLKIIAAYKHTTSIFDDFSHYEKRQEEEDEVRKTFEPAPIPTRSRLDQERQNRNKQ